MTSSLKKRITDKYKNMKWDLDIIPYIGKNINSPLRYKSNNKPYNEHRNILIIDLGLAEKNDTVEKQATQEGLLKKFIDLLDEELKIDDIVYHCFLNRKIKNTLNGFSTNTFDLYKEIKKGELKTSAEILEYIIRMTRPDIIFVFGPHLNSLINISFNNKFNEWCQGINCVKYIANDFDWEDKENIKRFLCDEKKLRYNAEFSEILKKIQHQTEELKAFVKKNEERYKKEELLPCPAKMNFDDSVVDVVKKSMSKQELKEFLPLGKVDADLCRVVIKRDLLIYSLNDILKNIKTLCNLKKRLTDADKNYYKPPSENLFTGKKDRRVRAGRQKRKQS